MEHNSPNQTWNASGYKSNAGFVATYGEALLDLVGDGKGKKLLDIGCGDGHLTLKLQERGFEVTGLDSSAELLEHAQERGLKCIQKSAEELDFKEEFDCIFSNAALHWMLKPESVLQGVYAALKPDGKFVAELGGHGNVASIVTALIAALNEIGIDGRKRNPWFFPSPDYYAGLLEQHGFKLNLIQLTPRPTPLPTGISGWLATFANPFLNDLDDRKKEHVLSSVQGWLEPSLCDEFGNWTADYVRLKFSATRL